MMRLRLALAASLVTSLAMLAACEPAAAPPAGDAGPAAAPATLADTAAAGCTASVDVPWGPVGPSDHPSYRVEAFTTGSVCESSVVTLLVRARDGFPIYAWAQPVQYLFALKDAKDPAAMQAALGDWISRAKDNETTASLPAWEETDGQPKRAEFPFMPAESYATAEAYDMLKAEKRPMLCFPQGAESEQCLALYNEGDAPAAMYDIGLQLFPG